MSRAIAGEFVASVMAEDFSLHANHHSIFATIRDPFALSQRDFDFNLIYLNNLDLFLLVLESLVLSLQTSIRALGLICLILRAWENLPRDDIDLSVRIL